MRWLLTLSFLLPSILLLTACPPELCSRGCDAWIAQCGEVDYTHADCTSDCEDAGTWSGAYVQCLEAARSCTQIGLCPP